MPIQAAGTEVLKEFPASFHKLARFGSLQKTIANLRRLMDSRPLPPATKAVDELLTLILARTADDSHAIVITQNHAPYRIVHVNDNWVQLCGFSKEVCTFFSLPLGISDCRSVLIYPLPLISRAVTHASTVGRPRQVQ